MKAAEVSAIKSKVRRILVCECYNCGDERYGEDSQELAERLHKIGWRVTYRLHLLCPECFTAYVKDQNSDL
jgi:hypothetical protein